MVKKLMFVIGILIFSFFIYPLSPSDQEVHSKEIDILNQQKNCFSKLVKREINKTIANDWKLIFEDEFNEQILNTNWTAMERSKNFNNELQSYTKNNVSIMNGRLRLIGAKSSEGQYTSGLVQTKGKLDLLYGKVEVKAKYPGGKGLFPAIWMLHSDEKNPLPEIDILEAIGSEPTVAYMVHHRKENGKIKTRYKTSKVKNYEEDHIYSMEWEPKEIRWYIDGNLVFSTNENVPNVPMYLIINLAVGGNWPGKPDMKTHFPAEFSIDYVKIYKRAGE